MEPNESQNDGLYGSNEYIVVACSGVFDSGQVTEELIHSVYEKVETIF